MLYYSILLKHFRSHHLVHTDTATGKVLSKTKISNTSTSIQVPSDDSVEIAAVASVQCTFVKQTVALFSMTVEIDAKIVVLERALGNVNSGQGKHAVHCVSKEHLAGFG